MLRISATSGHPFRQHPDLPDRGSPPPCTSTYDESPRILRAFCYAWEGLVEVGETLQKGLLLFPKELSAKMKDFIAQSKRKKYRHLDKSQSATALILQ